MVMEGMGWTFDTVAETYEKLRPGTLRRCTTECFSIVV